MAEDSATARADGDSHASGSQTGVIELPRLSDDDAPPLLGPAAGTALHVMSFNVRMPSHATPPGSPDYWPDRMPIMAEFLQRERPTLLGVQEAVPEQMTEIGRMLPGYRSIGGGREVGLLGEASAIFYDAERIRCEIDGQFWLSDTPDHAGSMSWGNSQPRIVTWGRMRDLRTGREFAMLNTHFDHESENARLRSAGAIADFIANELSDVPVIVTGDFNEAIDGAPAHRVLVESGLAEAWALAQRKLTPDYGTFVDYEEPVVGDDHIDWMLVSPGINVDAVAINTFRQNGRYPSDHLPIQALITIG